MLRQSCLYILLLFFSIGEGNGQNRNKVDSLVHVIQTSTQDTTQINALLGLFLEYYLTNPDTAFVFCEKALLIAEKANLKGQMAECYGNLAYLVQQRGDFSKALEYSYKCVDFFEESIAEQKISENLDNENFSSLPAEQVDFEKNLKNALAAVYNNIGVIYEQQGEIDKGLEHHFLSLKLQEEIKNKDGMATSYNNIGVIYYGQKENDKALEYCFLSLNTYEEIKDKQGMAYSYNNIGAIYDDQGEIDKALKYYFLSLNIREKVKDKRGMAESYHNIGDVLCALDSLEEGMRYLKLGLAMSKELGYKARISDDYSAIGALQLKGGQLEVALENGLEALAVAKEIGHVDYMGRAAKLLSDTYRKQSKFEDALTMYELEIEMKDSIVNEENTKTTIRQQMKYEYEKEQILAEQVRNEELRIQQEDLKRRNSLHYSAIFIGLLVLFGGIMALGFIKVSPRAAEAVIFISFLILFEFILILADPYIEEWTGGAPGYKLLFNAILAGAIFPLHQFFEGKLKKRLVKVKRKKWHRGIKPLMIALLVISHSHIFAQNDSIIVNLPTGQAGLKSKITNTTLDTTRINILLQWGEAIYLSNPDSAFILWSKAKDIADSCLSKKSEFTNVEIRILKKGQAEAIGSLGYIHGVQGKPHLHLQYSFESSKIIENLLDEKFSDWAPKDGREAFLSFKKRLKKDLASAYSNIAFIYDDQGEIEKALKYNFLSLKLREEVEDKRGMAISYNNIGYIHKNQGENEKALEYYLLSLKLKKEINNKRGMAYSYNNIGYIYMHQGQIEKALEYYLLSLKLREEVKDKQGLAESYHNIGHTLCKLDSLDQGMRYLKLGLALAKELGYKARISDDYSAIGALQLKGGQLEVALENGLEAMAVAKEIGHVEYIRRAAGLLTKVYKTQGKFKDALGLYELEIEMRDSIVNDENTKATIRQQMKYEHEKEQILAEQARKDQLRIIDEQLSRRDNLHYSAIFIGILILFGGVLMLGFVSIRPKDVEGIIFISFLILFEFVLVLADPHIEQYTGGAPGYKLLFNAGIAGLMFPLHQFFEGKLKKRVIKIQRKKLRQIMKQYKKDTEEL